MICTANDKREGKKIWNLGFSGYRMQHLVIIKKKNKIDNNKQQKKDLKN